MDSKWNVSVPAAQAKDGQWAAKAWITQMQGATPRNEELVEANEQEADGGAGGNAKVAHTKAGEV